MNWQTVNWRCPRCRTQARCYEGEELVRSVCWLCWVELFPTHEQRETELAARRRNRQKLLEGAVPLRAAHAKAALARTRLASDDKAAYDEGRRLGLCLIEASQWIKQEES